MEMGLLWKMMGQGRAFGIILQIMIQHFSGFFKGFFPKTAVIDHSPAGVFGKSEYCTK
jgi:hypothetical protein